MVKALLCDVDGTLVQSNWIHAEAWQVAFRGMGLELDVETLRRQIGKGGSELIPVFVPWWKRDAIEEPLKAYRKFVFQQDFRSRIVALPGAREFLERVHATGIKIELASSSDKDDLQAMKDLVPMGDLVDRETSSADAPRAKPHPDIFAAALAKLRLRPSECIALGDTPYDAESAGKAGILTIGVTTGGWSREELLAAGCVEAYEGVAELAERLEESALVRTGLHEQAATLPVRRESW